MKKGFVLFEFCCISILLSFLILTSYSVIYYISVFLDVNKIIERDIDRKSSIYALGFDENGYRLIYSAKLTEKLTLIKLNIQNSLSNKSYNLICSSYEIIDKTQMKNVIAKISDPNCYSAINRRHGNNYSLQILLKISLPKFIQKNLNIIGLPSEIIIEKDISIMDSLEI